MQEKKQRFKKKRKSKKKKKPTCSIVFCKMYESVNELKLTVATKNWSFGSERKYSRTIVVLPANTQTRNKETKKLRNKETKKRRNTQ